MNERIRILGLIILALSSGLLTSDLIAKPHKLYFDSGFQSAEDIDRVVQEIAPPQSESQAPNLAHIIDRYFLEKIILDEIRDPKQPVVQN